MFVLSSTRTGGWGWPAMSLLNSFSLCPLLAHLGTQASRCPLGPLVPFRLPSTGYLGQLTCQRVTDKPWSEEPSTELLWDFSSCWPGEPQPQLKNRCPQAAGLEPIAVGKQRPALSCRAPWHPFAPSPAVPYGELHRWVGVRQVSTM